MAMPSRGGITTINYDTIEKLYASYLPFIENGALFIPTNQQQQLGSQTFVAITLPNSSERMPLHGKVVWVNHRAQAQQEQVRAQQLPALVLGLDDGHVGVLTCAARRWRCGCSASGSA